MSISAVQIKEELARIGGKIVDYRLVVGAGGNISARCGDIMYISPSGFAFEDIVPEQYVGVNIATGQLVDVDLKPSSEFRMHLACYRLRPDIHAVVHTHPPLSTGVATGGGVIPPMFPDFVIYIGEELPILPYIVPTTQELADAVGRVIKSKDAVVLANHGVITVGTSLKNAFTKTHIVEESARMLLAAKLVGEPRILSHDEIVAIRQLDSERYRLSLLDKSTA